MTLALEDFTDAGARDLSRRLKSPAYRGAREFVCCQGDGRQQAQTTAYRRQPSVMLHRPCSARRSGWSPPGAFGEDMVTVSEL